ncbi:MAG: hypothetical protein Q7R97_01345 [Candidatus Daviesbacteria bacterium]|nr:hypothetical protein [Candidatus Daviesbacteria bacterium]
MNNVDLGNQYAFGWITSLGQGTNLLITPVFSIAMAGVVLYFIIGGLQFLLSGGDKEAIAKAQKRITHAIIGFILLIVLFLFMQFFVGEFLNLGGFKIIK